MAAMSTNFGNLPSDMTSLERLIQHLEHQLVTSLSSDGDAMTSLAGDVITSYQFKSKMALDGEAILPPLVTRQRRAECVTYRHQAVLAEARMRARRKDRLLAQVQEALDTVEDTSPRSRIFPDPSLSELEQRPATRPNSIPAPVSSTNKPTVQIPVKPKAAWPVQQTSAQSPTVQHAKLPIELQESSSSSGDATMGITQSYMFHSSDSSEYQTTVIARDDESELKQVSKILREEKRQKEARLNAQVPIPDGTLSHVPDIELERPNEKRLNASDRLDRLDTEKIRRPSGESAVSDPGVAPRSRGLSRALGLVKDVVGSNERLHREEQQEDISSSLSSDHMFSTASTDIMQYMKVPMSSMSSTSTMDNTRPSTGASERTLVEGRDGSVLHIGGAESGETSTDPPRSRQSQNASRVGKHEHLKRYLQQVCSQPLSSSGSQASELNSTGNSRRVSDPDDLEFSVSTQDLQSVGRSRQETARPSRQSDFGSSVTEEELMIYQSQQFDDKRRQLEKQQRLQLERLMEEQRREKDRLQQEMLEQEERLRRAQHQLYHGTGPESPQSLVPPHVQAVMKQDVLTDSDADDSPRGLPFGRVLLRGSNRYHADNRYSYHEASPHEPQETFVSGHDSDPETPIRAVAAARRRRPVVRVPEKIFMSLDHHIGKTTLVVSGTGVCVALDPAMKTKYDRISAAVKGYLTRRLLRTEKVRGLIKTIKDTAEFAISFHSEASIKNGIYSMQDLTLQERVIAQLRAALLEVHEIFFEISIRERMAIIDQSRELERERRYRTGGFQSLKRSSSDTRGKKLSVATQRALERKKQARLAEQSVLTLAEEMRRHRQQAREQLKSSTPHSSTDQQPHRLRTMDISGPIRRQFNSIFNRALRPIQGQSSPVKPTKPGMEKDAADRPYTAPAKTRTTPKEDLPASRIRKVEHSTVTKRPSSKTSSASSKTSAGNVPTTRLKSANHQNNINNNNNSGSGGSSSGNTAASNKLLSKPTLTTVPVSSTNRRR